MFCHAHLLPVLRSQWSVLRSRVKFCILINHFICFITAVGVIDNLSAAFVKLPQSTADTKVCQLFLWAACT